MEKRIKELNISITVALTVIFALLGYLYFCSSYIRLGEGFVDLWNSIKFYLGSIFGFNISATITVTEPSQVFTWSSYLPKNFDGFKESFKGYFQLFFTGENVKNFFVYLGEIIGKIAKVLLIILPCILGVIIFIKLLYGQSNVKHNKDTIPLRIFKATTKCTVPVREYIKQYVDYVKANSAIYTVWLIIWALHLNLVGIVIEFLAFYLYFSLQYDFINIYVQVCKLIIDFNVLFKSVPVIVPIGIGIYLFDRWRRKIALNTLRKNEARNCGFINELPIVSMDCGSMGKRKTTAITDMAISQDVMFRQKAFELLQKNDMKFPFFSWIAFETELRKCIEHKTVYNLATIKEWVKLKQRRYEKHRNADWQLYGYDVKRYGDVYYDGLKRYYLFDVLSTYARLYFIYVIESCLIVSNYAIRTDNVMLDAGNFPMWVNDFFPETKRRESRFSHILDFDVLRLGKKVIEDNPNIGSFEFGVVVITEVGKERGNNLELKELKKGTEETNQKNDLFNSWLKMCRHSATVDNFPFIKVFTDEQRPESWGADARDLCEIVHIVSAGETKLALPFYTIEEMIADHLFRGFMNLYYDFRYRRGDNTLLVYLFKWVTSVIFRHNVRIYNRYGFSQLKVEKEAGTMDGKPTKKTYCLMNQKIYSSRFSTDCFSDYFNDMAKKTNVGLNDYIEYACEKASVEELKLQNSYFINSLYNKGVK